MNGRSSNDSFKDQYFTVIGKETSLKGDFQLNGQVFILGHLEGTLSIQNQGSILEIAPSGSFKGNLKAHAINIYGLFEGELEVSERVEIYPGAIVKGPIHTKHLKIHSGADITIEGHASH